MRRVSTGLAFAALLSIPAQAQSVTAADFFDRMSADQRAGFIDGALDMMALELAQAGQGERAECVLGWYFQGDGPREVAAVFPNHPDLPAAAILRTLAERHC